MKHVKPRLFGVLGHPVAHSLSPMMHNAAYEALHMPYHYHAYDVHPDHIQHAIQGMRALGVDGVNVTIPHKQLVMPYLDEIDEEAQAIGAVNTIVRDEQGRLIGYNTDGAGYVKSLISETKIELKHTSALLIGAGGAAKALGIYLLKSGCPQVSITNRTQEKAEQLAAHLQQYAQKQGYSSDMTVTPWKTNIDVTAQPYQLIINTTSVGMWPHTEQLPVQLTNLHEQVVVSDIVYNPLQTSFLEEAHKQGAMTHGGLGMFIFQGLLSFEYFTGEHGPLDIMRTVVLEHLERN